MKYNLEIIKSMGYDRVVATGTIREICDLLINELEDSYSYLKKEDYDSYEDIEFTISTLEDIAWCNDPIYFQWYMYTVGYHLLVTGSYLLTDENGNDFVEQASEFEYWREVENEKKNKLFKESI